MSDNHRSAPPTTIPSDRLDEFERKLDAMHLAIVGNRDLGHEGLVNRVTKIERKVDLHNAKFLTWGGIIIGIMAAFELVKQRIIGMLF